MLLLLLALTTTAQTSYIGFVDGAHPFKLVLNGDGITGSFSSQASSEGIDLVGACTGQTCKFSGRDTAFVLNFVLDKGQLTGTISLGNGRVQQLTAQPALATAQLPTTCATGKWLRTYTAEEGEHLLTIAALPGQRILGSLFVRARNTSYGVDGNIRDQGLELSLSKAGGLPSIGQLTLKLPADSSQLTSAHGVFYLGGDSLALGFELSQNLPMGCLTANDQTELVYPLTQNPRANATIGALASDWWKALTQAPATPASGWFEPTRIDAQIISGWMHFVSDDGYHTEAINISLANGKPLRSKQLVGPRRGRKDLQNTARKHAIAHAKLSHVRGFTEWARHQAFDNIVASPEGLTFGSNYHPLYGQLTHTEPWAALPHSKRLAAWLVTQP